MLLYRKITLYFDQLLLFFPVENVRISKKIFIIKISQSG